jgi:hypothetical protein
MERSENAHDHAIADVYASLNRKSLTTATNSEEDCRKFVKNVASYGRGVATIELSTIKKWLNDEQFLDVHFPTKGARDNLKFQCKLFAATVNDLDANG